MKLLDLDSDECTLYLKRPRNNCLFWTLDFGLLLTILGKPVAIDRGDGWVTAWVSNP
jgi:hypothetical protein